MAPRALLGEGRHSVVPQTNCTDPADLAPRSPLKSLVAAV